MVRLRELLRVALAALATLASIIPILLVRALTLNAERPTLWVGSRCCYLWAKALCRLAGVHRIVEGRPAGEVFLVASNHLSYLDILVLGSLYPSTFVAKKEIAGWPLFGWITRMSGTLFVDRERARDVVRVGRSMQRYLERGVSLTLFPEGQATRGAEVLPFMPSLLEPAAATRTPCYAVTLHYETPGEPDPPAESVCWHSGAPFVPHVRRLARLGTIEARVRFSERPLSSPDRKHLARELRQQVLLGFRPVRQSTLARAPGGPGHSRGISQTSGPA